MCKNLTMHNTRAKFRHCYFGAPIFPRHSYCEPHPVTIALKCIFTLQKYGMGVFHPHDASLKGWGDQHVTCITLRGRWGVDRMTGGTLGKDTGCTGGKRVTAAKVGCTANQSIVGWLQGRKAWQPTSWNYHLPVICQNDKHKGRGDEPSMCSLGLSENMWSFLLPHTRESTERVIL